MQDSEPMLRQMCRMKIHTYIYIYYWNVWTDRRCLLPVMWPISVYAPNSSYNRSPWFSWIYYAPFAWLKNVELLEMVSDMNLVKVPRYARAWNNCTGFYCDIVRLKICTLVSSLHTTHRSPLQTGAKEPNESQPKPKFYGHVQAIPALMWDIKSSSSWLRKSNTSAPHLNPPIKM